MIPGPCVICGGTNYELSCGGPTICPKCDCGHFDAATVLAQAKVMQSLRAEIERLQGAKRRALQVADERAKECVALRAALKSFAALASEWDGEPDDLEIQMHAYDDKLEPCLNVGDFRRARAALIDDC